MYQWIDTEKTRLRRLKDGACIPTDIRNRDYREAQVWASQDGNAIADADPPPPDIKSNEEIMVEQLDAILAGDMTAKPEFQALKQRLEDKRARLAQRGT